MSIPSSLMHLVHRVATLLLLCCSATSTSAVAQQWALVPSLGGEADERARLAQLLGHAPGHGFLLRSATDVGTLPGPGRARWALLAPEVLVVNNSAMPFSLNDGALWAARGWSEQIRAGLRAQWGRISLVLAPEVVATENLPYELPPPEVQLPRPEGRSPLSTPWHVGAFSIDLPLRFGSRGFARGDPGQSTLAADLGHAVVGVSTANEWWGPGIRNAIVLSNNAPGIPRAFARTSRPLRTTVGAFAGRWFVGGLAESPYFDGAPDNDRRSITALAVTWAPAGLPDLTLGLTRAVYAPLAEWTDIAGHALNILRDRGPLRVAPGDSIARPARDHVFSLFGRWVFPADRFAVHAEWARTQAPRSLRELLTSPNRTQGYTLGLEWARPLGDGRNSLRLQAEVTYLEKSPAYRNAPEATWYTSAAAPQGYTQRGQVIGAAIGPGASSQWIAADYFAPTWRVGIFGGRIRWDNDALYTFPSAYFNKFCAHDVSLFGGVAAALQGRLGRAEARLSHGQRLNVFYYHTTWCGPTAEEFDILDVVNTTLEVRFSLSP